MTFPPLAWCSTLDSSLNRASPFEWLTTILNSAGYKIKSEFTLHTAQQPLSQGHLCCSKNKYQMCPCLHQICKPYFWFLFFFSHPNWIGQKVQSGLYLKMNCKLDHVSLSLCHCAGHGSIIFYQPYFKTLPIISFVCTLHPSTSCLPAIFCNYVSPAQIHSVTLLLTINFQFSYGIWIPS